MAPQESNVMAGTKRPTQVSDLFSLSLPIKRKKNRKRKNNDSFHHGSSNGEPVKSTTSVEIITIDSDDSQDESEKSDDIIVVESTVEGIDLRDHEVENSEVLSFEEDNIVININQPVDINRIMQSETRLFTNRDSASVSEHLLEREIYCSTPTSEYPRAWTKDMIDYYTKPCEEKRNFDYKEILKTMKSKPSDWFISPADRYSLARQKHRFMPCRKCRRAGHMEKECKKNVVCYICGEFNHIYLRCPNTLCLTCGKPTERKTKSCSSCLKFTKNKQSCALCGQMYHSEQLCPSKWRQYLILGDSTVPAKPNPRKFCYNCAEKGHFGFECPLTPYSEYPAENPIITTLLNLTSSFKSSDEANNNSRNAVIPLCPETVGLLKTKEGGVFLKTFSDDHKLRVEFFHGPRNYVKILGKEEKINLFRRQLSQWKIQIVDATRT